MPFMFDLDLPGLSADDGAALEQASADAGAWPVRYAPGREERRLFGIRKAYPPVLEILTEDGLGHVLVDPDHWDERAWRLRDDAAPRLATLLAILHQAARDGFTFRATWAGSPIEQTVVIALDELQRLVLRHELSDHTRYRVPAADEAGTT